MAEPDGRLIFPAARAAGNYPFSKRKSINAHWPGNSTKNTAGKSSRPAGNPRALAFNFPVRWTGAQCGLVAGVFRPPPARPGGRTAGPGVAWVPGIPGGGRPAGQAAAPSEPEVNGHYQLPK